MNKKRDLQTLQNGKETGNCGRDVKEKEKRRLQDLREDHGHNAEKQNLKFCGNLVRIEEHRLAERFLKTS